MGMFLLLFQSHVLNDLLDFLSWLNLNRHVLNKCLGTLSKDLLTLPTYHAHVPTVSVTASSTTIIKKL